MNVTKFRKGFKDVATHEAFVAAMMEGDCAEIAAVLENNGCERPHIDTMWNALPRAVQREIGRFNPSGDSYEFGSSEHSKELALVMKIADNRDMHLADLEDAIGEELPIGYTRVSRVLDNTRYKKLQSGADYGMTQADFTNIQSGAEIEQQFVGYDTGILTGRDAAAFVFSDNPLTPWIDLAELALEEGAKPRIPDALKTTYPVGGHFAVYGAPWVFGLLGQGLRMAGLLSFRDKWTKMRPRPEEDAPIIGGGLLPLAYAEGSPMHPTDPQMHGVAAMISAYLLAAIFEGQEFEDGTSVPDEALLQGDNLGYWRVIAGVHYPRDHASAKEVARQVSDYLIAQYYHT